MINEKEFLSEVSKTYLPPEMDFESKMSKYIRDIYKQYINQGWKGLELGSAEGVSTNLYAPLFDKLTVLEGCEEFLEKTKSNVTFDNVEFRLGLFEDLSDIEAYDAIIANYIFEHVVEPELVIKKCYEALKDKGVLMIAVPNAEALSRQMAVIMGVIPNAYSLTENDLRYGHRRYYDMNILTSHITSSPFRIIKSGGVFVKPFAGFQMFKMLEHGIIGEEQIDALVVLAEKYPEIAGSIYVIAQKCV